MYLYRSKYRNDKEKNTLTKKRTNKKTYMKFTSPEHKNRIWFKFEQKSTPNIFQIPLAFSSNDYYQ